MPHLVTVPTKPPSKGRRWLLLSLGLVVMSASAVIWGRSFAETKASQALEALGERYGFEVRAEKTHLPFWGGAGFEQVSIALPGQAPFAHFTSVTSDLSLIAALFGKRRPDALTLSQARVHFRHPDELRTIAEHLNQRRVSTPSAQASSESAALTVNLRDLRVTLDPVSIRDIALPSVQVVVSEGVLHRDTQRALSGELAFTLNDSEPATLRLTHTLLHLEAETPLGLKVKHRSREHHASLAGFRLDLAEPSLELNRLTFERAPTDEAEPLAAKLEKLLIHTSFEAPRDHLEVTATGLQFESREYGNMSMTQAEWRNRSAKAFDLNVKGTTLALRHEGNELSGTLESIELGGSLSLDVPPTSSRIETLLFPFHHMEMKGGKLTLRLPKFEPTPEDAPPVEVNPVPTVALTGLDEEAHQGARPEDVMSEAARERELLIGLILGSTPGPKSLIDVLSPSTAARLIDAWLHARRIQPSFSSLSLSLKREDEALLDIDDVTLEVSELGQISTTAKVYAQGQPAASISAQVQLSDSLEVDTFETKLSGTSVATQLARLVPHLSVQEDAEVDLELSYTRPIQANAPHAFSGHVDLRNFSFQFWRISDREVRNLEARVRFEGSLDQVNNRLLLHMPRVEVGEAHFTGSLDLTKRAEERVRFNAEVSMPRQNCGAAARSIPKALIPNLSTLALRGQMAFHIKLGLDLERPRELTLDVDGELADCQVLSLGPKIKPQELKGKYVHRPHEPKRGTLEHIRVGPGTREWVPAHKIPDHAFLAAWVTEDRRYTEHQGVRWDLVRSALRIDLAHGRFIYGGSTITQQLVKNLYLTRDKHLARKLEEAIIAWQMERVLTKEEILLLYVNCIEYGPDIYGIKAAAETYFNKTPMELNPLESAFLMGLKPYPRAGFTQFRRQTLDIWWVRRVSHVMRMMAKYGPEIITLEAAEAFTPFQPTFAPFPGGRSSASP